MTLSKARSCRTRINRNACSEGCMDPAPIANLGEIGALFGSAAYFTHLSINGITLALPRRPSWTAFAGAMGFGVLFTILLAIASGVVVTDHVTGQVVAQIVLVGISAGGAAAGTSVTQASAEARRRRENKPAAAEPDPTTPTAQPHPATPAT